MSGAMTAAVWFALLCGIGAVFYGWKSSQWITGLDAGNARMQEIAAAIQAGAKAYLNRQYRTIAIVGVVLFLVIGFVPSLGWPTAIGFAVGALLSGAAGFIGMNVSVQCQRPDGGSIHATASAKGLTLAFNAAALITGMLVAGFALCWAWLGFYYLLLSGVGTDTLRYGPSDRIVVLQLARSALGFGARRSSRSSRVSAAASSPRALTSAPTWSARSKPAFPKTIPRNPAVIADNVGDNVGDCAGMAADLFETYAVTLIATMLLGALMRQAGAELWKRWCYPLVLGGIRDHRIDHRHRISSRLTVPARTSWPRSTRA